MTSRITAPAVAATGGIEYDFIHSPTKPPRPSRNRIMAVLALATLSCGGGTEVTAVPRERVSAIGANFNGQTIFGVDSLQAYAAAYGPTGDSLPDRIVSLTALTPTVATITAAGVIHTHAEGIALFGAITDGFTDTLKLQVFLRRVARVTAIPDSISIVVGDTVAGFVRHAYDASGREMENVPFYIYAVRDSGGVLSYPYLEPLIARHAGTALVAVTADTAATLVKVTVRAVRERVARIEANFDEQTIFGLDSLQAHAEAYGPNGDSLPDQVVVLSALTPAVASITAAGVIHTHADGIARFAATADGLTDTLGLQVFLRRVARVTAIPDSIRFKVGDKVENFPFAVHAYDVSGREIENAPAYYDITKSLLSPGPYYSLVARQIGAGVITVIVDTATTNVTVTVTP